MAIGKTNVGGGSGGTGGTLTVTTPGAGITVTVSKDGKTKTKVSGADGVAAFKGLATGTWTLTITDGIQTASKPVVVTADYNTTISFFSATINVTYPAGSTCTATDGVTTLTAPDTSGTWACVVPNAGTWEITSVPGIDAYDGTVVISSNGEIKYADITKKYIFRSGSGKIVPFTTASEASLSVSADKITIDYSEITRASSAGHTTSAIDITSFKKLCITANVTKLVGTSAWTGRICASTTQWSTSEHSFQAYKMFSADNTKKVYELDISSLSGNYYVGFWGGLAGSIYDIYLAM